MLSDVDLGYLRVSTWLYTLEIAGKAESLNVDVGRITQALHWEILVVVV